MTELSDLAQQRIAQAASRDREEKIGNLMRLIKANVERVEHDPEIIHDALVRSLLLFLVTELFDKHEDETQVMRMCRAFFNKRLVRMVSDYNLARKLLPSND